MVFGTVAAYQQSSVATKHFGSSLDEVPFVGKLGYIALTAFVINVIVAVVLTFVFRAIKSPEGVDQTEPSDYYADEGDPRVQPIDELTADTSKASST
jgi:SSS family solute:Na+ symporter